MLHGLGCAISIGADPLHVFCDSKLVVNQISGEYAAKDEKMSAYLNETKGLLQRLHNVEIDHIGRELNGHTDLLASLTSAMALELKRIITVGLQDLPSIGMEAAYTNDHTWGPIYGVCTQTLFRACSAKSTKECVEDIPGEDP